jgi:hypothetical protein
VNEEDVFSFIEEKNADMFWQSTDRHTRAAKNKNRFQTFFGCIFQPFATRSFDFVVIRDRCAVHHPCRRKRRRGLSDGSSF